MKNKVFKKFASLAIITVLSISVFAGCNSSSQSEPVKENTKRPIIVQGPMPIEAEEFAQRLREC